MQIINLFMDKIMTMIKFNLLNEREWIKYKELIIRYVSISNVTTLHSIYRLLDGNPNSKIKSYSPVEIEDFWMKGEKSQKGQRFIFPSEERITPRYVISLKTDLKSVNSIIRVLKNIENIKRSYVIEYNPETDKPSPNVYIYLDSNLSDLEKFYKSIEELNSIRTIRLGNIRSVEHEFLIKNFDETISVEGYDYNSGVKIVEKALDLFFIYSEAMYNLGYKEETRLDYKELLDEIFKHRRLLKDYGFLKYDVEDFCKLHRRNGKNVKKMLSECIEEELNKDYASATFMEEYESIKKIFKN